MRLLIAAATTFEIDLFQRHLDQKFKKITEQRYCRGNIEIYICITGIGMMQAAFSLSEAIQEFNPHFCLQIGVAGAFNRELHPAELVIVQEEILGDMGVEDNGKYLDLFDIELLSPSAKPFTNRKLINAFQDFPLKLNLPFVTGLTVNTVSGTEETIRRRAEKYNCDVESMEGAAFHYACIRKRIPFLQVRSISNYVEPRDKSKWKMKEAIEKLNQWAIDNLPE